MQPPPPHAEPHPLSGLLALPEGKRRTVRRGGCSFERNVRMVPAHPQIEDVVKEEVRQHGLTTVPCGVPLSRSAKVPSGMRTGASSHRIPVSTPIGYVTTRHQRFTRVRLLETYLTEFLPPFPQRSPPGLLTLAAWGGLKSALCRPASESHPPSLTKLYWASRGIPTSTAHDLLVLHSPTGARRW